MYYLRTRPAADPIKFTVDKTKLKTTASTPVQNGTAQKTQQLVSTPVVATTPVAVSSTTNDRVIESDAAPKQNGDNQEVEKDLENNSSLIEQLKLQCSLQNKEACLMCSS